MIATFPQLTRNPQRVSEFSRRLERPVQSTGGDATLMEHFLLRADVAELADALDLGSSARKGVGVQVSPSAPIT